MIEWEAVKAWLNVILQADIILDPDIFLNVYM